MKKIFYSIIAAFGLFATTSCEDMLMTENDSMVIDPELGDKTDSAPLVSHKPCSRWPTSISSLVKCVVTW